MLKRLETLFRITAKRTLRHAWSIINMSAKKKYSMKVEGAQENIYACKIDTQKGYNHLENDKND